MKIEYHPDLLERINYEKKFDLLKERCQKLKGYDVAQGMAYDCAHFYKRWFGLRCNDHSLMYDFDKERIETSQHNLVYAQEIATFLQCDIFVYHR